MLYRHWEDVRVLFATGIAERLGRDVEDIRAEGLGARDFRSNESVELTMLDGSSMNFRNAFVVFDVQEGIMGVFTEHCGYFCFPLAETRVHELRDGEIIARHDRSSRRPGPP